MEYIHKIPIYNFSDNHSGIPKVIVTEKNIINFFEDSIHDNHHSALYFIIILNISD